MQFSQGSSVAAALPGDTQWWASDSSETLDAVGIDGETAGGIEFKITAQTAAAGANVIWLLKPNDLPNNLTTTGDVAATHGIAIFAQGSGTSPAFEATVTCASTKTGANRVFTVVTTSGGSTYNMTCTWADSTTPIRAFRLEAVNAATGAVTGTALTAASAAGVPTGMRWRALGQ